MNSPIPPAFSIPKSNHLVFDKRVPGPGEYQIPTTLSRGGQNYSFSKSPRKIHDVLSVPGPGNYNPKNSGDIRGISLGKSPRVLSNYRTISPGPGEYSYLTHEKRYQFSISKARSRAYYLTDSPGPGYYNPSHSYSKDSPPKPSFSKQPRIPNMNIFTPSPGHYELPASKTQGFTIPKSSPRSIHPYSPGPGVYEIPSSIGIAGKVRRAN